jgi:hypothetical protein
MLRVVEPDVMTFPIPGAKKLRIYSDDGATSIIEALRDASTAGQSADFELRAQKLCSLLKTLPGSAMIPNLYLDTNPLTDAHVPASVLDDCSILISSGSTNTWASQSKLVIQMWSLVLLKTSGRERYLFKLALLAGDAVKDWAEHTELFAEEQWKNLTHALITDKAYATHLPRVEPIACYIVSSTIAQAGAASDSLNGEDHAILNSARERAEEALGGAVKQAHDWLQKSLSKLSKGSVRQSSVAVQSAAKLLIALAPPEQLKNVSLESISFAQLSKEYADDEMIAKLTSLPVLRSLDLSRTPVSPDCTRYLAGCAHLENLKLDRTKVNNYAIGQLSRSQSLQDLSLRDTLITDQVTEALLAMPRLSKLDVSGNGLHADSVRNLRTKIAQVICDEQ